MAKKCKIHLVPHTHWDREWYFTLEEFRYRLVKLMDRLIDLMEKDVITYFVADGHTILLEDYLAVRPENRERLHRLTAAGRLIVGPWYTQPNIFMSGAEAQVRNLLKGRREMEKWGGGMADINYLPDQFGYTSQLPQMMQEFGMTHLVGARGLPKKCDTYFRWVGADGSAVYVCALPHSYINACAISEREEPKTFSLLFGAKIVMPSMPERMDLVLDELNRAIAPQILALNGVDHMYPNPHMAETLEAIRKHYPDVEIEQSNFRRYIDEVEATLTREPTICTGEQRDGRENLILPASQSTRMDIKKYNRKMEDTLTRRVEPLLCLMQALGETNLPLAECAMAWELILQNQAHDSLCCANSEPSYREIYTRYEKADDIAREIENELEQRLIRLVQDGPAECLLVRNPSAFDRNEPVRVDVIVARERNFQEPHLFRDGEEIPSEITGVTHDALLRYVPFSGLVGQLPVDIFHLTLHPGEVPAGGFTMLEARGGGLHPRAVDGLVRDGRTLENQFLRAQVETDGSVTLTDKRNGQVYSGLGRFMDSGEAGCGFIHVAPYEDPAAVSAGTGLMVDITENNLLRGELTIRQIFSVPAGLTPDQLSRRKERAELKIVTRLSLRQGADHLEFETEIDNTAVDHRLRVIFPSDVEAKEGYAGQPFDVVTRPVQPEKVNLLEEGDYEPFVGYHPMNDFCGITDGRRGAAVAGDGIMEYEILPMRATLCLTLIRATDRLHVGVMGSGSKFKIPAAQLQGKQTYRYAFIPHAGGYENALSAVEVFRNPLYAVQKDWLEAESMPDYTAPVPILPKEAGFFRLTGGAVLTCCKPAEDGDGMILRFYNPSDETISVQISVDPVFTLTAASRCRMDESAGEEGESLPVENNGIRIQAAGKKIVTLRLSVGR